MCRNIKILFNFEPPVTEDEIRAASLQFVRKITGFNKPSKANEAAFLAAVDEVAAVSGRLLHSLDTAAPDGQSVPFDSWQKIIIEQYYYSEESWCDDTKKTS